MTPEKLKQWREKHGVSQQELADLLQVHKLTISKWECAVQDMPPYLHLALNELSRRLTKRKDRA